MPKTTLTLTINSLTPAEVCAYMGINDELRKAESKHPDWPKTKFEQMVILLEEVGEVAQSLNDRDTTKAKQELHQVGAMVVRILKNLNDE